MSDRQALLAAICANPDDDTPRLVFADWLDEHGEGKRAAFIRAGIEAYRQSTSDNAASAIHFYLKDDDVVAQDLVEWSELDRELHELCSSLRTLRRIRFRPTPRSEKIPPIRGLEFTSAARGFLDGVAVHRPAEFLKHCRLIFRASPITSIRFERLSLAEANEFLDSGYLAQIRELAFGSQVEPLAIRALGDHRDAACVRELALTAGLEGQSQCEALASGSRWTGVRWLELRDIDVGHSSADLFVAELLHRAQLQHLRGLIAPANDLGNATARAIATRGLTELRYLDLGINSIGNAGAAAIARTKLLPNLRYLDLGSNDFTGETISALITTPKLPRLNVLKLDRRPDIYLDLKPLTRASRKPTLRVLQIDGCELVEDTIRALTECPAVHGLWFLSLAACSIGDRELRALAAGSGLQQLRFLNLSHNNLTAAGMKMLTEWPALKALRWLAIFGNKIGDEGAKALVVNRYLKDLKYLSIRGSGTARLRRHFGKKVVP